jgi:hypothetical protein
MNTIFWNNDAPEDPEIYAYGSNLEVVYSDITGGWPGEGNIDDDPLFENPEIFDFHLETDSYCIDGGDPDSPPDPDGTNADIGAYYFDQREILAFEATDITEISFTANWQAAEDATGYLLDVATDESFTNFIVQNLDVSNVVSFTIENLNPETVYYYRLRANYCFGRSGYSDTIPVATISSINESMSLSNILETYPNPFTHQTTIHFTLSDAGFVNLEICDITARKIKTLHSGFLQVGEHGFEWDAGGFKEGLYILRLHKNEISETRKLLLLK